MVLFGKSEALCNLILKSCKALLLSHQRMQLPWFSHNLCDSCPRFLTVLTHFLIAPLYTSPRAKKSLSRRLRLSTTLCSAFEHCVR
jgi:hypothetical protein